MATTSASCSGGSEEHDDVTTFSLTRFEEAYAVVRGAAKQRQYKRTPLIAGWKDVGDLSELSTQCELFLKLETMQVIGCYKVRGVLNQLHHFLSHLSKASSTQHQHSDTAKNVGLVTMSAGNYGKAFAFITAQAAAAGLPIGRRVVVMPEFAPVNRQAVIESFGAEVIRVPNTDLVATAEGMVKDGAFHHMQSINSDDLILGHGSLGLEILEEVLDPDIVLVPCGGGALLSGVAATIKLSLQQRRAAGDTSVKTCRVYGVEPEGANAMWQSLRAGKPVAMPNAKSIASGLAPPFAGDSSYRLCSRYVDDIILVSDSAIAKAVTQLYKQGLVVEPSGAVGYAALAGNLVPDVVGRKVVLVFSGGNVTVDEMAEIFKMQSSG